jgi:hypothetical protein
MRYARLRTSDGRVKRIPVTPLVKPKRRRCAYKLCKKRFMPRRPHQKFCCDPHRLEEWKRMHPRVQITEKGGARRWIAPRK